MAADVDDLAPEPAPAPDAGDQSRMGETAHSEHPAEAETAQSELDLGVMSTGSLAVDRALLPLEGLTERPVSGHAEVFEQVLDELAQTMAGPDAMTGPDAAEQAEPGVPPSSH